MACFRVKYRIEYNITTGLYRLPKAPELIKIANIVVPDVFFDTASDNDPIWFDPSALDYDYGGQWFFDVANNKNMIVTDTTVTGDCLNKVLSFVDIGFKSTDVPGGNISGDYIVNGDENMEL